MRRRLSGPWQSARDLLGRSPGGRVAVALARSGEHHDHRRLGIQPRHRLRGLQQVWSHTCDPRYVAYIQKYADENVSAAGVVNIPAAHSFDNIQPSVLLPFLFQRTGLAKYRTAAEQIRARYDTIPTNADGGFWHKQAYPNQMWLDSMYMGEPFLARYGAVFGTCGTFCSDTVFKQMLLLAAHVRDPATGLLYHAWDDSPAGKKASWADPRPAARRSCGIARSAGT